MQNPEYIVSVEGEDDIQRPVISNLQKNETTINKNWIKIIGIFLNKALEMKRGGPANNSLRTLAVRKTLL